MDVEPGSLGGKLDEIIITVLDWQLQFIAIKRDHLFEFDCPQGDVRNSSYFRNDKEYSLKLLVA